MIAVAPSSTAQTAQHPVERRVRQIRHNDRNGVRLAENQAAGERAGRVVEPSAAARTFSASASSTDGLPFITLETVASETPARAATSAIVRGRGQMSQSCRICSLQVVPAIPDRAPGGCGLAISYTDPVRFVKAF